MIVLLLLLSASMNVTTNDRLCHCSLSTTHCHFIIFVNVCRSIIPCMDRHWRGRQLTYPRECCCNRVVSLTLSLALPFPLLSRNILLLLRRSPDSTNEGRASLLVIDRPFGLTGGQSRTPVDKWKKMNILTQWIRIINWEGTFTYAFFPKLH